jgi:amino acid adenylation domain-containing protein/non-ribosomal peptide synthase protein (TIGR01720 family)
MPAELGAVVPYKNYIRWLSEQDSDEGRRYWEQYLDGFEQAVGLPKARPSVETGRYRPGDYTFSLDETVTSRIAGIAGENRVTVNTVFQTLWGILLQKYNDTDDVIFGAVVSGRPPELDGVESIIGLFINTVPVRVTSTGDITFSQLSARVHERAVSSKSHEYVSLAEIQSGSPLKAGLIDHIMAFENFPVQEEMKSKQPDHGTGFTVENIDMQEQTNYDFNIVILPGKRIRIVFNYNALVYEDHSIERAARHFEQILRRVAENPRIAVKDIEMMTADEKRQVLSDFNDTAADYPADKTVHELFETQAAKTPGSIALVGVYSNNRSYRTHMTHKSYKTHLSYEFLNRESNQLACVLREKGVTTGTIVGLQTERSVEMIVGILAILKAGGAYLPIDPGFPDERKQYMLDDSGAKILLTHRDLTDIFTDVGARHTPCNVPVGSSDLAYVIYTSGSTGRPKGVMIEHRSLVNFLYSFYRDYACDFGPSDNCLSVTNMTFDVSVNEFFLPLVFGSTLVLSIREEIMDVDRLLEIIIKEFITYTYLHPTLLQPVSAALRASGTTVGLNKMLVGVEPIKDYVLQEYLELNENMRIINAYGPTEATICATRFRFESHRCTGKNVPIGSPLANTEVLLLDRGGRLVPVGVPGELYIGGCGLARGYMNNPELTAQRFVDFNRTYRSYKSYRTGDLARWRQDGNIEFLGRVDFQVKVRGFRVEPGEIESRLLEKTGIKEAVVIAREEKKGGDNLYLCAYIVSDGDFSRAELREWLGKKLPDYMIPSYFVQLERIPVTPNGKVDRKALPEPEALPAGEEYVQPRNKVEETLAETWQKVLGIEKIGIRDNFFEIGGDSIKAIQVSAGLKKYGLTLKVNDLFLNPTIEQLAHCVAETDRIIHQGTVEGEVELTPIQEWFFESDFTCGWHFNQAVMIYAERGFDETFVEKVFTEIIRHHDALRMIYRLTNGNVVQENRGTVGKLFDLEVFDMTHNTHVEEDIETQAAQIQGSICLDTGPLVKLGLFKTDRGDHLLIVIHHLVVDGISWRILLEDFRTGYEQLERREDITFQEKTDSFKYWAARLKEYSESKEILSELEYWQTIEKAGIQPLPVDEPVGKGERKARDMESCRLELEKEETRLLLSGVNQAYNTEITDILLVALGMAVKEWGGIDVVAVNLEGHGREPVIPSADVTRTVGWFTTQFPVLLDMSGTGDLSYRIKSIKETLRRIPNNGIGCGLLRYLTDPRKTGGASFEINPEITFNYMGQFHDESGGTVFTASPMKTGNTVNPEMEVTQLITINGVVMGDVLEISFTYNKYLFKRSRIGELVDCYKNSLSEIIRHCTGKEKEELTPSDVGDDELSLVELEEIQDMINL